MALRVQSVQMDLQQGNLGEKLCVMPRVLNANTSFGLDDHAVKQIAMALKTLTTSLLLSSGSMGHPFRPNLKQDSPTVDTAPGLGC